MNNHISRTSTFSAPVVQSRLEHHHQQQQQMSKQPEARQHHQSHQRSKSLSNKGKRYNHQHKVKETNITPLTTENTIYSRNSNKNFSNYSNNFDSSYYREQNVGYSNNSNSNNFFVDNNGSVGQLQRKTSTSSKPSRRHQHSDSVDEDKLRTIPTVSILKRPQSATDFVRSSNSKSISSLEVTREENGNNHYRPNKVWEKSPPQQRSQSKERRRSDVTPSRSKRTQRKEIKSMEFDTDLMLNASNIQLSGSGDESDVNSNKYVKSVSSHLNNKTTTTPPSNNNTFIFPPLNYSNAIIALEEEMNSNKKEDEDTYANSDDNIVIKSKKRLDHYVESSPRRLSGTAIELQSQVARFADSDSDSNLSSTPSLRPLSSSPGRLGGGAHKLYAGPTFHNSPAPSDLPMPSFYGKSLGKEPGPLSVTSGNNLFTVPELSHSNYDNYSSPSSGNTSDSDDIFAMDDLEPSKVPYYTETHTLRKQTSGELLRILNARQHQTAAAYMVPERMATAHHPMQVYPSNDLNEISETLRNLLKIHGQ